MSQALPTPAVVKPPMATFSHPLLVVIVLGLSSRCASLIAAVSGSFLVVLIGRVPQSVAMGYIPVAISLIKEAVPFRMVNASIATVSATPGVGGALGLLLAAWVVEAFDWHALFWLRALWVFSLALPRATTGAGRRLSPS